MTAEVATGGRAPAGDELDALLGPIAEEQPTGPDLRTSGILPYREIEDLLQGRGKGRGRSTEQNTGEALAQVIRLLLRESKDLGLACLGAQALLGARGIVGLLLGLRLLHGFHSRLFDSFHPQLTPASTPEDERGDVRLRALRERKRLLERTDAVLQEALLKLPLCPAPAGDERVYGAFWWIEFDRSSTDVTMEELNAVALQQPREHYQTLAETLHSCMRECDALNLLLDRSYSTIVREHGLDAETPYLGGTAQSLRCCLQIVEALVRLVPGPAQAPPGASDAAGGQVAGANGQPTGSPAPVSVPAVTFARIERYLAKDRADSLAILRSTAEYLQSLEPLSPVPHLLFRAVRWAESGSLSAWLDEMSAELENISDRDRARFELGLVPSPESAPAAPPGQTLASATVLRPQSRADALVILADTASYLHALEPLSPVPYLILRALTWARADSPESWLGHLFPESSATLLRIRQTLGLGPIASGG